MEAQDSITGCILGTAVGDALGLPYEGLTKQRAAKQHGSPDHFSFFFRRGMVSDDTEHTCLVAQALIESGSDLDKFQKNLSKRMRRWFLTLPAGVGLATARAMLKSLIGFSPSKTGVFSAGNGPAMRSALLGATIESREQMALYVKRSCEITHTDPKAFYGALAVALAAKMAKRNAETKLDEYLIALKELLSDQPAEEFINLIEQSVQSVEQRDSTEEFAVASGLEKGVSGYVYHTVPIAIHAWLSHQNDYAKAIKSVIRCGGDADTTAAIVGGIVGTHVGQQGIPTKWLESLYEWPRTVNWMQQLGNQLTNVQVNKTSEAPLRVSVWAVFMRNIFFLGIVLLHGFRRLFPPY